MKNYRMALVMATPMALVLSTLAYADRSGEADMRQGLVERGRYVVTTSGCNDCHTPGYPESGGALPMTDWLTGSNVGFRGPWGTTYPANLRYVIDGLSEKQWMREARKPHRPPMPWFSLRDMSDKDLRSVYWFIRSLGGKGAPVPQYVPPGGQVSTMVIDFVPHAATN